AFHAAFLQNGRDVPGVGNFAALPLLPDPADETARRLRRLLAYFLAAQQRIERLDQLALHRLGPREADAVLVVDASPVANHALLIEHKDLRRAQGAELIGDHVAHIFKNGEGDAVHPGIAINGRDGLLL